MDKDNIVIIDLNTYNGLIMNNKILREENEKLRNGSKIYEDYFYNDIFKGNEYYFENIKEYTLDDYYVRSIISSIFEYGNIDINYIIQKIKDYKSRKESESDEAKK